MSEKILLMDGNYILRRSFYGVPELKTSKGFPTNAIKGTLNTILYTLDNYKPDKFIMVYDYPAPTFRHLMYNSYKATREETPEEFKKQRGLVDTVISLMGFTVIQKAGYEADDIIGTIAKTESANGNEVMLYSADHDMFQLIDSNISQIIPGHMNQPDTIWTPQDVKNKHSVTPEQFVYVKALMGDKSDNIPGVTGIGPKTAEKLIAEYGNLECVYSHLADIKSKSIADKLSDSWENVMLSYTLVRIKKDVPLLEITETGLNKTCGVIPENKLNDSSRSMLELLEMKSIISVLENGSIVRVD